MPLAVLSEGEKAAGLAALEAPFRLLLSEHRVKQEVQEVFGHFGVVSFEVFAKLEGDEASVRRWVKSPDGLGIDGAGMESRVLVSTLLVAWDACRDRVSRRSAWEAEQRAAGRVPGLMRGDVLSVRRAFEKARGPQRDEDAPGKGYLELKIEEFNDGELSAEHLSEVTSVDDEKKAPAQGGSVDLRWDNVLQLRTGRHTVAVPRSPEEFRHRVRLMRTMWGYLKLKGVAPQLLAACDGSIWDEYAEYILGPQGWALRSLDSNGQLVAAPSWKGILRWEHELRKEAIKDMNNGTGFEAAIRAAMKNTELRMRYLLQPIALTSATEALARMGPGGASLPQGAETGFEPAAKRFRAEGGKGDSKSGGRGGGKGGAKGQKGSKRGEPGPGSGPKQEYSLSFRKQRTNNPSTVRLTVGDKKVCYDYQSRKGCSKSGCIFLHVCALCGETEHGYEKPCPKVKALAGQ